MSIKGDATNVFEGIGFAIAIMALCIGIGGCHYLCQKGDAKMIEARAQAKLIEAQAKQIEEGHNGR